jgi:hypothetical protein
MDKTTLFLEIWPIFSVSESYEIACIKLDSAGCPFIIGTVGPYLTKEEAKSDLSNITEKDLTKKIN